MRTQFVLACAVVLMAAGQASAQEFRFPAPQLFVQKKPAPKEPEVDWNAGPPVDSARRSEASVVCGMTMVPADPTIDPKIRVAPSDRPANRGVSFTMRVVEPTVCKAPQR